MHMLVRLIVSAALFACAQMPVAAQEPLADTLYCAERNLGRHFYCDRAESRALSDPEMIEAVYSGPPAPTALEEVAAIRAQLEELRAEAVLRPTPENVVAYIRFQRQQLDRASVFSDVWRRALWTDPSLDYTLERPVSGVSKHVWLDSRKEDRGAALAALNERYGLFYFYAASCSACIEFSPILKAFADRYGIAVKAVSVDGGPNVHFPDAVPDAGRMARLGLAGAPTPTVVLFDTQTKSITPVASGLVAGSELEERIFVLTRIEPGEDF